ncbi:AAA family ATPase [Ferroplasma sp. Type II]|uniref:AAA family ATPase n=1 Tax=Ferroplasma sp. Type II TaxID=261388 RepID=UPI0025C09447|nr:AAA family ATPase [Ferroplasma sp. Type II]
MVDDALQIIKKAKKEENDNHLKYAIKLYREAATLLMNSARVESPEIAGHRKTQARSIFSIADILQMKLQSMEEKAKKSNPMILSSETVQENKIFSPVPANREPKDLSDNTNSKKQAEETDDILISNAKNSTEDEEFLSAMGIDNINIPETSFEDVAGLDSVKDEVKVKILLPLIKKDLARMYDINAGGGILMYGPPGNGKTFIARAIAHEAHAYFININPSNLLNQWFGRFENNIETLFKYASKHSPAVLFFDEIDAITPKRSKTNSSYMKRAVPALLSEMDGIVGRKNTLLIIGATNNPWDIDEAFLRPGRFGERIYIPPPDVVARELLFKMYLKNALHDEINYGYFSEITENFSAADIKYICDKAKENVFKEVTKTNILRNITENDILEVIQASKPSVSNDLLAKYIQFRDS